MQKFLCLLLILILLTANTPILAATDFDPGDYTAEELNGIMVAIREYLSEPFDWEVIYDDGFVTIQLEEIGYDERNNIKMYLHIENKLETKIRIDFEDSLINRADVWIKHGSVTMPGNSIYKSSPYLDFVIEPKTVRAYGISDIERIDFVVRVRDDHTMKTINKKEVTLLVDIPVE